MLVIDYCYTTHSNGFNDTTSFINHLQKKGNEGWSLCHVMHSGEYAVCVFARAKTFMDLSPLVIQAICEGAIRGKITPSEYLSKIVLDAIPDAEDIPVCEFEDDCIRGIEWRKHNGSAIFICDHHYRLLNSIDRKNYTRITK